MKARIRIWIYPLVLMGMLFILASSCKKIDLEITKSSPPPTPEFSYYGNIMEANTKQPIKGVTVIASKCYGTIDNYLWYTPTCNGGIGEYARTVTDEKGYFQIQFDSNAWSCEYKGYKVTGGDFPNHIYYVVKL